ncbi:hypothetical protein [Streptomyces rimosus]|uniref:hypothetical protein n=1 Tax=Streptomyces rimosus TaxID=1927 RepID=UPI0004C13A76|nr:hypothetical protein [Streptomyces rimosus]
MDTTTTGPPSPDELIDWLAARLDQFDPDQRLTPLTLKAAHPGLTWTRARNALYELYSSGLLHRTGRGSVYALRPDLPAGGRGHLWLRLTNRAGAAVEVVAAVPRPASPYEAGTTRVRWICHGCARGEAEERFGAAAEEAEHHAVGCRGEDLSDLGG